MASALERAARAVAGKFAVDWDRASDEQKESAADVVRAVLMAVRDLGEAECERVRGCFPGQDVMADTLFALSIDAILNEKDTIND